jgi:hypothetical protein
MQPLGLVAALIVLIVLDLLALRFGADSREGFTSLRCGLRSWVRRWVEALWRDGRMTDLGAFGVQAINNRGRIVAGRASTTAKFRPCGTVASWPLDLVPGATYGSADDINDLGGIAGYSGFPAECPSTAPLGGVTGWPSTSAGRRCGQPAGPGFRGLAKPREHWHAPVGNHRTKDRLSNAQRAFNRQQAGLRALVEQSIANLANAEGEARPR